MRLRSRQSGLGALGWLVVLAVASFFLLCFFRIGPLYLEYFQVKEVLDDVLKSGQANSQSKQELLDTLQRRFDVNRTEAISTRDIRFSEGRSGREVDCSYEKRVPLVANIDVVVKFDQLKYTLSAR